MTTINSLYVPSIPPGTLFSTLSNVSNDYWVRWITPLDPVHWAVTNRPLADIVFRQLIIAKSMDNISLSLAHQAHYPFLIQARIASMTGEVDLPTGLIWDVNISLPGDWAKLRLAKIKRISGDNESTTDTSGTTYTYTGKLRFVFTGQFAGGTETAILQADYDIESSLTYQVVPFSVPTSSDEDVVVSTAERATILGHIIFKTQDASLSAVQAFYNAVAPSNLTDSNSDGLYDSPSEFELLDATISDSSGTYNLTTVTHGTGLLLQSTWNQTPNLGSDIQSWVEATNYPFDVTASLVSDASINLPVGLFREFNLTAPAGDQPTDDTTGLTYPDAYPVWLSRIERLDDSADSIRVYLSTYNITDASPSQDPIEFASFDLTRTMEPGQIVAITPDTNLLLKTGGDAALWMQHFGRGHVVLSSVWQPTRETIANFFDEFLPLGSADPSINFALTATRLSSFALSRVPKYTPTAGQAAALLGSTSRRDTPVSPSTDNRYVTESDQGQGDQVDFDSSTGIDAHDAISRYGYTGSLCHKLVRLQIDGTKIPANDATFYDTYVLPRLRILFGRDPIFGDVYYNGTQFKRFNGSTWQD